MKRLTLILIKLYQKTLSPDHGLVQGFFPHGACKYRPTCSEYAYDAISAFGILKGCSHAAKRVLRCHPWTQGGYDPVT